MVPQLDNEEELKLKRVLYENGGNFRNLIAFI